jgi:signal transduction histidine kinase
MNLFQRLALEFFRDTSPQSDFFVEKKLQLKAEADLLDKQKKKADERRKEFRKLLDTFFERYESGEFERREEEIRQQAAETLRVLLALEDDGDLVTGIRKLETSLQAGFQKFESDISISKPRGLAFTKKLEKDWAAYRHMSEEIREIILSPLRKEIVEIIREATKNRISEAQHRETVMELLEKQKTALLRDLSALRTEAYNANEKMRITLRDVVREEFGQFRESAEKLLTDFTRDTARNPAIIEEARAAVEHELIKTRERETALLDAIKRQLTEFAEALRERETVDDRMGALEQRSQRMEEQLDFYSDFAQMGMAVGILQHEFEKTAGDMRIAMRDMKPWADGTPTLKTVYKRLRDSFDHIDGYLKILDPLGRRLNRSSVEISGDEIRIHLMRIFQKELDENGIDLKVTDKFLARTVACHSSALLAAFINVMDNAIYWVTNGAKVTKIIRLDVDEIGFLISNTGPGIEERMRERIFEFGETTKPGGRGMGLTISKETLRKEGFDLELIRAGADVEPVFRIKTVSNAAENEDVQ